MLTCRIHAKEDLRIEDSELPEAGPGQVLIRLGAGGICGSDLHYYYEGRNGSFVVREPLIPGHEASGVVAKVGAGVTRVKSGDKIAVSPSHACGQCDYCREGREQLCRNMRFLGSASLYPHVQGMFCEYFVMGERQCYPVAADVSLGEIAFAEPLAVALHAVNRGRRAARQVGADHRRRHDRLPDGDRGAARRRDARSRSPTFSTDRWPRRAKSAPTGRSAPTASRMRWRRRSSTSRSRFREASSR